MLEVSIDRKRYRAADGSQLTAIDGLRFSVAPEEFLAVIGPSGCGKTTLLRLLAGLDSSYQGLVSPALTGLRLGMVFQEPRLLPWFTVEQNVRLALPKTLRQRNLDALFARLGLGEMRGFYPAELSLGLARRAAIARAFALDPEVLILDEPFVSLDEATATGLRQLLAEIWQARPTMALMVTHDLREALILADRILFLTPRPARWRGEYRIERPRHRREADWLAAEVTLLADRFPGVV